jgi:hypothetical protein
VGAKPCDQQTERSALSVVLVPGFTDATNSTRILLVLVGLDAAMCI